MALGRACARLRVFPPFPEYGRLRLIDFPIEKVIVARPGVHFDAANFASEIAGVPG